MKKQLIGIILVVKFISCQAAVSASLPVETRAEPVVVIDCDFSPLSKILCGNEKLKELYEQVERAHNQSLAEIKKRHNQHIEQKKDNLAQQTSTRINAQVERRQEYLDFLNEHLAENYKDKTKEAFIESAFTYFQQSRLSPYSFVPSFLESVIINAEILDEPKNLLTVLKEKLDPKTNDKAQYLILSVIYAPDETKTERFKERGMELHQAVVGHFEKITAESPYIGNRENYRRYLELTGEDPLGCFEKKECLLPALVMPFGFMGMGNIVIPCKEAIETKTVAVLDGGGGGHGASTANLSNCHRDPNFKFPDALEDYYAFVRRLDYTNADGSIRYLQMAANVAQNLINRYTPDFTEEDAISGYPLYDWGLLSHPNFNKYREFINYGIGFDKARALLSQHYQDRFHANRKAADRYAILALTPFGASINEPDPTLIRHMILNAAPLESIAGIFEEDIKEGANNSHRDKSRIAVFTRMGVEADSLLHLAINRPDVVKYLLEACEERKDECEERMGIGVDAKNHIGKTPLMYAAQFNVLETVRILLDGGKTNIDAQTNEGDCTSSFLQACMMTGERTALMYAVQEGNYDVAVYLIEKGADRKLTDTQGKTAYDYLHGRAPARAPSFRVDPFGITHGNAPSANKTRPPFTQEQVDVLENLLR